ncbi:alpha/beta hydrolase [Streptomyces sp. NRRL F-4489]|uniref:alpha/beta fold hydrolase n=1 Tax=Streptomyces sp. NRRL F-4489 TaxID=1609095 RepID=UPI000747DDB9|nr:alpha/beta hydrolase [Streptomyces sp. NRRL F-4489]KUL38876.1 alpha/beta hydrolase [Streptomyces sp. NRRL F-4489]
MTDAGGMSFLDTSDGRLAYREAGNGAPLVLLHGGFLDHRMWDDQIPALAPDHRVIAPDVRGHGASANATKPFRYTDDLAALLRHLETGPAILVGVSMGGAIAVDTALEHPELVRALVVSGVGTSEPEFRDPWVRETRDEEARALAAGDIEGWVEAFTRLGAGPHRTLDDMDHDVVRRLREMARRTITKHTADEPDHRVPVADTWDRATKITVPVLAINGASDSPDHIGMAERLIGLVANGRATAVPGAGHYPNMESPDLFNDLLRDFLRDLPDQEH